MCACIVYSVQLRALKYRVCRTTNTSFSFQLCVVLLSFLRKLIRLRNKHYLKFDRVIGILMRLFITIKTHREIHSIAILLVDFRGVNSRTNYRMLKSNNDRVVGVPDRYICPSCCRTIRDPMQFPCGHRCCKPCIKDDGR